MDWNSVETLPDDYVEVVFTDGRKWYKGHIGTGYDYVKDVSVHPVWITESADVIEGVTHWFEPTLPA